MNDLERRLTDVLARKADEADVRPVDGFAEYPHTTAFAPTDTGSVTDRRPLASIGLASTGATHVSNRPTRPIAQGILAVACTAAVVAVVAAVVSRGDGTMTVDAPVPTVDAPVPTVAVSPLEEPSRDEVTLASNYNFGTGPTEVTAARRYVSLNGCPPEENPDGLCDGEQGWAYVAGSSDNPEVHYGLLGMADNLVLSPLDDRYFVASAPSPSTQDPQPASPAWLIDSVTGQRGALTWTDQPTTLDTAEQELVLFPVPHLTSDWYPDPRSLPRVVDKRDWTIRPLRVPEDASPALAIHQPGLGRIWIGTAPDGGDVGLAYTDDGGASWTDVELPESLRLTSEELPSVAPTLKDGSLVVAAVGDHVAVTARWDSDPGELLVSADAGESWDAIALDPSYGHGRGLFVLSDDRLLLVSSRELSVATGRPGGIVSKTLRVSSSASDWSQLERSIGIISDVISVDDMAVEVNQQRIVGAYDARGPGLNPRIFSTDLNEFWTTPDSLYTVWAANSARPDD